MCSPYGSALIGDQLREPEEPSPEHDRPDILIPPVFDPDSSGAGAKRAARVADRLLAEIMEQGWPVGRVLGSETELQERYGVSRAVFREAVRLLEHRGVARTRRGPGGGLVVTAPSIDAVIDVAVLYLHRIDARLDEVFEARILLEEIACDQAVERIEEGDLEQLRRFVSGAPGADRRALHDLIAAIGRNPAITLAVEVLNRLAHLYCKGHHLPPDVAADANHAHRRIAEALIARDAPAARRRMRRHLVAEADFLMTRKATRQILPRTISSERSESKRAEVVARDLAGIVLVRGLRPGDLIGSESELVAHQGVSRAVFREAVRLLEYHRIAGMRRGPGGGLFVMEPSTSALTDVAALYLARHEVRLDQLGELRRAVDRGVVDLAAGRVDGQGAGWLRRALVEERGEDQPGAGAGSEDLHAALVAVTGNRVLELIALVLIRLSRLPRTPRTPRPAEGGPAPEPPG